MNGCKCPVCKNKAEFCKFYRTVNGEKIVEMQYDCNHCGSFVLPNDMLLPSFYGPEENYYPLSCYLFENKDVHDINHPLRLSKTELERISKLPPLSVEEKVDRILRYINNHSSYYGENVSVIPEIIYSRNEDELYNLIKELTKQGFVDDSLYVDGNPSASIKIKGIEYIKQKNIEEIKDSCFIAMWFSSEMDAVYKECIVPACIEAGYKPIRVDDEQFNGDITDKIIASIRTTHFTIADLTGYRGGVYYEAGFAKGLGKEVILTCRADWFDGDPKENKRVHFDVNHLSIIQWEESDKASFKQNLKDRIVATLGQGNNLSENGEMI